MATYTELHTLRGSSSSDALKQKIVVATAIKANLLAKANPTAAQKAWATDALASPESFLLTVMNYILADYNTATTGQITGATDSQVQTAVNAVVDTLLGA